MRQFVPKSNLGLGYDVPRQQKDSAKDYVECTQCSCSFFEEVKVSRYKDGSYSVPGQAPRKTTPADFILLRCSKCGELHEPYISGGNQSFQNAYAVLRNELVVEEQTEVNVTPAPQEVATETKATANKK